MSESPTDRSSLLAALVKTVAAVAALSAGTAVRHAVSTACGYGVVAGLLAVSACFLTFAGYRALQMAIGSVYASLIVGFAYLLMALVVALLLQMRRR